MSTGNNPSLARNETRGARRISGPLLFLERKTDLPYGAMVEVDAQDGTRKTGQVIEVSEELAVIQVFEDTMGLDVSGTSVSLREREARLAVSEQLIGRVLNGAGRPLDGLPSVLAAERRVVDAEDHLDGRLARHAKGKARQPGGAFR